MKRKQQYKTETALIQACLANKPDAQRQLYNSHVRVMYNTVLRYVSNRSHCEDILQEAFSKAFRHLNNFNPKKGQLRSWLRRICVTTAIDHLKKHARLKVTSIEHHVELVDHGNNLSEIEVEHLYILIEELPTDQRVVFNMHQIEGYSHKEIEAIAGIKESTSRAYLSRARTYLKEKILKFNYYVQ